MAEKLCKKKKKEIDKKYSYISFSIHTSNKLDKSTEKKGDKSREKN